jgi:hypothetical protein
MVHYRWHYLENTIAVIEELTGKTLTEQEARQHPLAQWGPRVCRATGTEHAAQRKAAETEYLGLMDALEQQLGQTAFALGNRPTAPDTILLGGLHGHTNADPIPDLGAYAKVVAWAEGGAAATPVDWNDGAALVSFPESTPFARHVLKLGAAQYALFVEASARALVDGAKAFEIETYGESTSYLARPYPEQSRRMIQTRIRDQLRSTERRTVESWLVDAGLSCFLP